MKNEKIGKVTLDYTYYPGEDKYSDGAIEDEMLAIAKNCREEEYADVIVQKKSWPILYHFSHVRENIIDWLPMTGKERVLEIGAGPGAITGALARKAASVTCIDLSRRRCMINAHRHASCENLKILVGNFQDIEENLTEQFDLITLIGVFEYAQFSIQSDNPFVDYLTRIRRHLAPGGRLVIAIENRIGLKYWAGATEDHTGVYFEGLEGYPTTDYVRTFSKPELENILREAGLPKLEFYYPYPDYKLPERIYSDGYLPKKGELNRNKQNLDRERIQIFQEERVYDSLIEGGLFEQFSNSFFVIAQPDQIQEASAETELQQAEAQKKSSEQILSTKYSNERREELRIRTDILRLADGTKVIRKRAASGQAWRHIQQMSERYLWLKRDLKNTPLRVNPCSSCKNGVQFPFVEGRTLEEKLDLLLSKKDTDGLIAELERYLAMFAGTVQKTKAEEMLSAAELSETAKSEPEWIEFKVTPEFEQIFGKAHFAEKQYSRSVSDIDMIAANAIEAGEGYELIDYEWTFDFPIPVKFIVYRCLYYYMLGNTKRDELLGAQLYDHFGISEAEKEQFAQMEHHFQQYILGVYTPIWKQYDDISEGVITLSSMLELAEEQKKCHTAEVFFDTGKGFGTWNWKKYGVQEKGMTTLELVLPKGTRQVRLDPCSCRSVVRIAELTQNGKPLSYTSNGAAAPSGDLIFDTEDPQIIFAADAASPVRVTFCTEAIHGLGREVLLNQQGHIRWMEQTKAWKLYQKLKRKNRSEKE